MSFSLLLLAVPKSPWHLQANDDTPGGWLSLVLYLVLAVMCWRQVAAIWKTPRPGHRMSRRFWIYFSLGITFLAINKQADFQTWFLRSSGSVARAEGVIQYRSLFQTSFIAVLAAIAALVALRLWRVFKEAQLVERMILAGGVALMAFIILRAASFTNVRLAGTVPPARTSMLGIELSLLVFLCFSVWCNLGMTRREILDSDSQLGERT